MHSAAALSGAVNEEYYYFNSQRIFFVLTSCFEWTRLIIIVDYETLDKRHINKRFKTPHALFGYANWNGEKLQEKKRSYSSRNVSDG